VVEVGATEPGASFDDVKRIDGASLEPVVTWGINPEMSVGVSKTIPSPDAQPEAERPTFREALAHMGFSAGQPIKGAKIDVAFVGSCTNGRLSDLRIAASGQEGQGGQGRARAHRARLQQVAKDAEAEGLHEIFKPRASSGARPAAPCASHEPGPARGPRDERVIEHRNFIGRQGSPTGRTLLMSPAMVAAAAITGVVTDVREILK